MQPDSAITSLTEAAKNRFNKLMGGLFMSSALVIALVVGLQGRGEGKGWGVSIFMGAIAGFLISYAVVLLLMFGIAAVRRVTGFLQKK